MREFLKNWHFIVKRYQTIIPRPVGLYFLLNILYTALTVAIHVLNVYVPSRVVALLENRAGILPVLLPVGVMGIVHVAFRFFHPLCYFSGMEFRMYDMNYATGCLMGTSSEYMESERGAKVIQDVSKTLYSGNDEGTEGMMRNSWDALGSFLILFLFLLMSRGLPWYWLLLLIFPSLLRGIASFYYNRMKIDLDRQSWENWHEQAYYDAKVKSQEAAKDIRLFHMKQLFRDKYSDLNQREMTLEKKDHIWLYARNALGYTLNLIGNAAGILILLQAYREGSLSLAVMVMYLGMMFTVSARVDEVIDFMSKAFVNSRQVSLYRTAMDLPQYDEGDFPAQIPEGTPELRFEHVDFSYGETEVIRDLNLTIRAGEHVALVGYNGAGKTTLVKLACGLLTPAKGRVCLNGVDIQQVNPRERYARVAMVFQDLEVFAASFEENIALQHPEEIDRERLRLAVAAAGAEADLAVFPNGLKTQMTTYLDPKGVKLSGGQTQRLMLARALYKGGDLLVLDEPTSALDPLAEAAMYEEYLSFAKGKTAIFISHRLSSTRFCDRVLFMQDGRLVQDGTHESLLREDGPYRDMFETQARHYREQEEQGGWND